MKGGPRTTVSLCALALILLCPATAGAQEEVRVGPGRIAQEPGADEPVPAAVALAELLSDYGPEPLTDLTVNELATVIATAAVATREREHVERSGRLAWVAPGLGHYVNGERGPAIAFAAADLAIGVTTAILAYWLVPQAVQHRNLNYLQSSFATIDERWRAVTPSELVPSVALVVSGSLLSATVRSLAARSAREAAMRALRSGRVTFEPQPLDGIDW